MDAARIVTLPEMSLLPLDGEVITTGRPDWALGRKQPDLVQAIDVRLLRVRDQPRRKKHTEDEIRALADELKEGPLRNAIHIRPDPEDRTIPLLLHGEGRVRAWFLKLSELRQVGAVDIDFRIPARLRMEEKAEHDWRLEQGLDNDQATLMDQFDLAQSYRDWLYDPSQGDYPQSAELNRRLGLLAKRTGKSRAVIESRLRLLLLCQEVRAQVAAGRVEISDASQLGRISDSGGQQTMLKRVILEGVKGNGLVAAVTEFLKPPPVSTAGPSNGASTGTTRGPGRPATTSSLRTRPMSGVMIKAAAVAKGEPGEPGFIAVKVLATKPLSTPDAIAALEHFLEGLRGGRDLLWDDEPAVGFE